MRRIGRVFSFVAALAVCSFGGLASAQEFYAGKTIRIVVGTSTGGGYDSYARLLSRHMSNYIPGQPTMVVVNMPGANGMIAANHLYNLADKDGTVFGTFNRYVVLLSLLGNKQAKFEPEKFGWLGTTASYSENSYLLVIRSALPHRTIEDLRNPKMPLHLGNAGTDVPAVLKEALGLNLKLVAGYKGSDELEIAFERGEVDAHTSGWTSLQSRHEDLLKKGFIRPMIQFGRLDRLPALADVPTARELATNAEDRALIEFAELPLLIARPFATPPGVPADRLEMLRTAFSKAVADPQYIAEGSKLRLELTPADGATVSKLVTSITKAPASVVERYRTAVEGNVPSGR
jgi:tripartite-type tricarboxylate transporter receptor subunit TctC